MSGIAGLWAFEASEDHEMLVSRMIQRLGNARLSNSKIRNAGNVCFGHAGLRGMADTEGYQMMHPADLMATIVFDGKIYNNIELREELGKKGHHFKTASDTEVLLVAYREWSYACVEKIQGMFTFVIYDNSNAILYGARDRFGEKPLLFWSDDKQFAFASELKALLELPFIERGVDPVSLCAYLEQLYVPEQRCIFKSIQKLPPGHSFTWRPGEFRAYQYWEHTFREDEALTFNDTLDRLDNALRDAVRVRLPSDGPVSLFLSGGIDSSLIAITAADLLDRPLKTYSVRMIGLTDETADAAKVSQTIASDHTLIEVSQPKAERIIADIELFDEPFADSSAVPMSLIAEHAGKDASVVLTGDGGDEFFGGYGIYQGHLKTLIGERHFSSCRSSRLLRAIRAKLPLVVENGIRRIFPDVVSFIPSSSGSCDEDVLVTHCKAQQIHYEPVLNRLLRPEWNTLIGHGLDEQRSKIKNADNGLNRVFEYDVRNSLVGLSFRKVNITTKAWGLEARMPILDSAVADLSMILPTLLKVDSSETKKPLKALLARRMGEEFVNRKKMGFGAPVAQWLANQEMREMLFDLFEASSPNISMWIIERNIRELMHRFYKGRSYLAQPLWNLLVLEIWYRKYVMG